MVFGFNDNTLCALGAADDPWVVFDDDIKAEIKTLAAVISVTNADIQNNKSTFSNRTLETWHAFVDEWLAWKNAYLAGTVFRARSGAWIKVKDFKRRALEWAETVQKKLGVVTPGMPDRPKDDIPVWGSTMAWGLVGVLGLVSAGYFIRSFGLASIARSTATQRQYDDDEE